MRRKNHKKYIPRIFLGGEQIAKKHSVFFVTLQKIGDFAIFWIRNSWEKMLKNQSRKGETCQKVKH